MEIGRVFEEIAEKGRVQPLEPLLLVKVVKFEAKFQGGSRIVLHGFRSIRAVESEVAVGNPASTLSKTIVGKESMLPLK